MHICHNALIFWICPFYFMLCRNLSSNAIEQFEYDALSELGNLLEL